MITLKQLEKIMKEEEITIQDLNNDREYIEILYRFLNDNNLIDYYVELRSNNSSDWWLQCEYYSNKLGKTIVWSYDFRDHYEDLKDLLETINTTEEEIKKFEEILPDLSTWHYENH